MQDILQKNLHSFSFQPEQFKCVFPLVKKKNLLNQTLAFVRSDMRKLRGMSEQSHYIIGTVCMSERLSNKPQMRSRGLGTTKATTEHPPSVTMVKGATSEQGRNGPPPTALSVVHLLSASQIWGKKTKKSEQVLFRRTRRNKYVGCIDIFICAGTYLCNNT